MIFKEKGKTKHPEKRNLWRREPKKLNPRFATSKTRRELEPKCLRQLILGSYRPIVSLSLVTVPEVFAKVNSGQVPSRF